MNNRYLGMNADQLAGLIHDILEEPRISPDTRRTEIAALRKQLAMKWPPRGDVLYDGPSHQGAQHLQLQNDANLDYGIRAVTAAMRPPHPVPAAAAAVAKRLGVPVIAHNPIPSQPAPTTGDAAVKICSTCPSFIAASDEHRQRETLGKVVNLPWCASRKIPLGTFNSDAAQALKIQQAFGKACDYHGQPVTDLRPNATVAPIGTMPGPLGESDPAIEAPESCASCRWHVPQTTMLTSLGLPLAGCARFGEAILPGQEISRAKACTSGIVEHGAGATLQGIHLAEPYRGNITVIHVDPVSGTETSAPVVEPNEYVTDAPVTDEDTAAGIRAWRMITDPDGTGNSVLMPIFDPARFDDVERAKIPQTGDDEHPELYVDHQGLAYKMLVLWRHMNETPALNGVPGVGKTMAFHYLAWMMQLPFERISITGSTEVDDLQGRFVLEGGETRFHYGRVPAAWQRPCVIVVDEPNVGPPEVWQFLRPLTDNSKQLVVDANKGERIARNSHCFLGMAFNPSWDMRNVGTHEISDADGSRLMHIAVPEPDEKLERKIITERCKADGYDIPEATLTAIVKIAADIRALAKEDAFPIHWGTRQQIKVGRASQWFTLPQAYRLAAGDLIDPESNEQLATIVKSHVQSANASKPKKNYASATRGPF